MRIELKKDQCSEEYNKYFLRYVPSEGNKCYNKSIKNKSTKK